MKDAAQQEILTPKSVSGETAKGSLYARRIAVSGIEDNTNIWAGYTYLAQLAVHDLSHIRTRPTDSSLVNLQDAKLNLSTIFGDGPSGDNPVFADGGARFAWGHGPESAGRWIQPWAVPPTQKRADGRDRFVIADPRNNDNLILLQVRNFFCLLYEKINATQCSGASNHEARQTVEAYFRAVIRDDLCKRFLSKDMYEFFKTDPKGMIALADKFLTAPHGETYREFTFGVGRVGHSMSRSNYPISQALTETFHDTLMQMVKGSKPHTIAASKTLWQADWRRLFDIRQGGPDPLPSRRLTPLLDDHFSALNSDSPRNSDGTDIFTDSLMIVDLYRTVDNLQSGQSIARRLAEVSHCDAKPITGGDLFLKGLGSPKVRDHIERFNTWFGKQRGWDQETPLLLYALIEAHNENDGRRLGPVGSFVFGAAMAKGLAGLKVDETINAMPALLEYFFD